jgi:hypothetical protein
MLSLMISFGNPSILAALPDFGSDEWNNMFAESAFEFPLDDKDWAKMEANEQAQLKAEDQQGCIAQ